MINIEICPFFVEYSSQKEVKLGEEIHIVYGICKAPAGNVYTARREQLQMHKIHTAGCNTKKFIGCSSYSAATYILNLGLPLACPLQCEENKPNNCGGDKCRFARLTLNEGGGYLYCDVFSQWFWGQKKGK